MSTAPDSSPITVAIARTVTSDQVRYVESWVLQGIHLAAQFPGFLGAGWIEEEAGSERWHMLYRFDTAANLMNWEASRERRTWLAAGRPLAEEMGIERRTGIEGWFGSREGGGLPGDRVEIRTSEPAPPVWKQAIIVWLAFFPMNLLITYLLGFVPGFPDLPLVLRILIATVLLTPVMVGLVLPWITRAARPWLLAGRR